MKKSNKKLLSFCVLGLMTAWSLQAKAAGYKMEFQSASTLADSGDAAVVEDAGTNWYNSAGLVYLPQQLALSGIEIYQHTKFSGTVTAPSPLIAGGSSVTSTTNSYPNAFLPGFHYVYPFKERWAVGLSVVPAWGLMEDYGNAFLRYNLMRIYTKTIDIAPSLALRVNDQWSVGLGPDFHYFSVESKNAVRTQVLGSTGDSLSRYSADHWNEGWHAGILFRLSDATRIGLNYRSRIVMHLQGYSSFGLSGSSLFGYPNNAYETNQFKVNIPLPPTTSLSVYHDMTPDFALMGTVAYDQWGIVNAYNAHNYQSITSTVPPVPVLIAASSPQNMRNTLDWGIGLHYKLNTQWMLRANMKYEPTPTNNRDRDVNFPDGDKLGFQIGARYQINKQLMLDLLYGHVFVRQESIGLTNPVTAVATSGHVNTSINLAGAQLVWNI